MSPALPAISCNFSTRLYYNLDSLEPHPSGFIRESFLETEIEQGLTQIAQITESLTDEANSIMNQVADIVGLPQLDDSDVQEGVQHAKINGKLAFRSGKVVQKWAARYQFPIGTMECDFAEQRFENSASTRTGTVASGMSCQQ